MGSWAPQPWFSVLWPQRDLTFRATVGVGRLQRAWRDQHAISSPISKNLEHCLLRPRAAPIRDLDDWAFQPHVPAVCGALGWRGDRGRPRRAVPPLTSREMDGRLLALLKQGRSEIAGVGVDFSEVMLDAARERFAGDQRVELIRHDLAEPLPALGRFDAVISSFAIHHLEHERKRSLYREIFDLLEPGGVFANFEHVASPTHRLHLAFFEAIGEPIEDEDPSDRTLDVHTQLEWLRALGFDDVNCYWKWLEMALLVGVKPAGG